MRPASLVGEPVRPAPPGVATRPLDLSDTDALCDLLVACRTVDEPGHPANRAELRHLWLEHPGMRLESDTWAAWTSDGTLAGAVVVLVRDAPVSRAFIMGAVLPAHRRRGIGTMLMDWAEARARALLADAGRSGGRTEDASLAADGAAAEDSAMAMRDASADVARQIDAESPAGTADRIRLFEQHGFRRARTFLTMVRDLGMPIPTIAPPAGLAFEEWRPDLDHETRLAHNDAFRDHWGSEPISAERWRHFVRDAPGFRPDCSWLAVEGGAVAGYVLVTLSGETGPDGPLGWLGTIGVRRAWRGRGLGTALIARSLGSLAVAGATRAGLDVDAENPTGAVRVYAGLGFRASAESIIFSKSI